MPGTFSCRFYGEHAAPQPVFAWIPYPYSQYSGTPMDYYDCTPVCLGRSVISAGFHRAISEGILYEFQWIVPECSPSVIYSKHFFIPPDSGAGTETGSGDGSWDYPGSSSGPETGSDSDSRDSSGCDPCLGGSTASCVHPYPRSVVVTPRPDLTLPSPLGDRTIARTYRSSLVGDETAGDGMFGKGWRANFEHQIGTIGGSAAYGVMLFDAAGRKTLFQIRSYGSTPAVYDSPNGSGGTITKYADGTFLWQDERGGTHQFDAAGKILSVTDIHGNQETFGYTSERITSLTDRHGRVVTFDYQGTTHVKRLMGPAIAANPGGVYATYSYDANGNLTRVSYPEGSAANYSYGDASWPSHLTGISFSGPRGPSFQRLFQYDAQGRVQAVSEGPSGRSFRLVYGGEVVDIDPDHPEYGQKTLYFTTVTEGTDADWDFQIDPGSPAAQSTYHYENRRGAFVLTKIEDGGCSCAAEKVYDEAYHVVESTDNMGVTSQMSYNAQGDLTSLTKADGTADERSTLYEYAYPASPVFPGQVLQKTTRIASVAYPGGEKVTTEINDPATGQLVTLREQGFRSDGSALIVESQYTYTTSGALQSVDGPRTDVSDVVTYDYHPAGDLRAGMLWKVTQPNGAQTVSQEYDALGNVLRRTDANGRDTLFAYNSRGQLQSQTTTDGMTSYEYDLEGNVMKITYPRGNSVYYGHGQAGVSWISDAAGRVEYDHVNGNKTAESVYDASAVLQSSTSYQYDAENRLWRTIQPSGDIEEFLYDANGNLTHKRLYAAGATGTPFKTTVQTYDALNRLTAVSVEGDPYHTGYGYDVHGNLRTMSDPLDQITTYSYDDLGRQDVVISHETGTTQFGHDEAGNLASRRDNLNRLTIFAHDGLGRVTDIVYPDAATPVHFRYDDYSAGSYPDAVGRLTEVRDASGERRFSYSPAGRLSTVVHAIDGREFTTQYGYDANGNLATLTYPDGRTVTYVYDPLSDRVQSVTSTRDGITSVLAEGITHKPFGPLTGLDYGNATHLSRDYEDLSYRLASLSVTSPSGSPLPARGYGYDPSGNISGVTRDLPAGLEPHVYDYDSMDRLLGWTKPSRAQGFTYDANGNRLSLDDNGDFTGYAYDPNARNIIASAAGAQTLTYDSDLLGNITGWGSRGLAYDGSGRLQRAEENGVTVGEYVYNSDGQRAKKIAGGAVTYFEHDVGGRLIHEYRAVENVSVDYVYLGDEPLAMLVSDNTSDGGTVVPLAGANGTLSPSTAQTVGPGGTASFTVTPNTGYHIGEVTGCGGTLAGAVYTTGPVTGDCTVSASFVINSYTVTPSAGAHGSLSPSTPQAVAYGTTTTFTLYPNVDYHIDSVTGCGGTLHGIYYTTGPITGACTVSASFAINTFTVTPSAGANGSLTPSSPQTVAIGETTAFTVQPNTGYHIASVSGCGGTLSGSIYTTGPISGDCTVLASFAINSFTVTPVGGEWVALTPSVPQTVTYGQTAGFAVQAGPGHRIADVTGCDGTLNGAIYTTGAITGDCTVTATAEALTYTVTPEAGAHGSLSPATPQVVNAMEMPMFTVTADTGYSIASVTGCGGVTINDNTYQTGPITADCTVTASFLINSYTVTPSAGANGNLLPTTPQVVAFNETTAFTMTPNSGYHVVSVSGCAGTVSGSTYTTGLITADCTVTATFGPDTNTLTVTKAGAGSGTVTSTPAGINCGAACSAEYNSGTVVSMTQTPVAGSVFSGWSGGGCSGTGACAITMNAAQTVTATYAQGITVTTPNGGEVMNRGTTYTVRWTYSGNPGTKVKIELLKAGVVNKTLSTGAAIGSGGSGSYSWKIANNQAVGADYRIRVTSTTATGYMDTSDANFTIN